MNPGGRSACCCFAAPALTKSSSTLRFLPRRIGLHPRTPRAPPKPSISTSSTAASISNNLDVANRYNNSAAYGIEAEPNTSRAIQRARDSCRDLSLWEHHSIVPKHTLNAFNQFNADIIADAGAKSIAIDSGCGTGLSTRLLSEILPADNTRIIGLDRSAVRLSKGINYHHRHYRHQHTHVRQKDDNESDVDAEIVRADMEHFWRLAVHNSWAALTKYQFFFYPNPYPLHLKRRIYGRPSFPYVVALGGRVEVRASWAAYLEDFLAAYSALSQDAQFFRATPVHSILDTATSIDIVVPISNFEKKFIDAEQPIYRLVIDTRAPAHRESCPFKISDDKLLTTYRDKV